MKPELEFFLPIQKIDEDKQMVWGYASTATKDLQGEVVELDAIKAALPDYMEWANIREMHQNSAVGVTKEANVDETGLYIGAKIVDPAAWAKCKPSAPGANDAVYKGFSIGGSKLEKSGDTIKKLRMTEISLVDRPANPDCRIDMVKAAGLVAEEGETMGKVVGAVIDVLKGLALKLTPAGHDGLSLPAGPVKALTAQQVFDEWMEADDRELERYCNETEISKREFSEKQRKHLASSGKALPDGSYPIVNEGDLHNAIQAIGRASDPGKAKAHIIARAKAMGKTHLLPEDWEGSTKKKESAATMTPEEQELAKRASAVHTAALVKVSHHLGKAIGLHGKAMAECAKCMSKAAKMAKDAGDAEVGSALEHVHALLHQMGDHHDIAQHNLSKAMSTHVVEENGNLAPNKGGATEVSPSNAAAIELHDQTHMTEGTVNDTGMFATNSPYSAAAMAVEINKAVTAAISPLQDKLHAAELEAATMKGTMAVLQNLPSGRRGPQLWSGDSISKSVGLGDSKEEVNVEIMKAAQSVDPNDPDSAIRGAARIIGLRAMSPRLFGKSITDPNYKGAVG